jgi:diguanylate cyclase (GGDEF)-like protein
MDPSLAAGRPVSQPETIGSPMSVAVFSSLKEFAGLSEILSQLSYSAVREPDGIRRLPDQPVLTATIVSDSVDRPLELCADVSKQCPTILVARDASFDFRLAAVRAGVDALLLKPVDSQELADWLKNLVGREKERPFSVLIVDDDQLLAGIYAQALQRAGMNVRIVDTAPAALNQFYAELPDLVLMDMQMPGVNGIELARMIRQSRRYLSIPIVFVSAEQNIHLQMEARKFGGDDFILKPVDPDRLVSLVRLRAERASTVRSVMERDSLTGLLNHGRFKDRLVHELERCHRTGGELSFAMIDLDRFKQVNDSHGHLVGDRVIRGLSNSLTSALRKIDIIGRYGGEEFGVILLDTGPHAAASVIDKLREQFHKIEFDASGQSFSSSFSAGVAGSRGYPIAEQIIAAADAALYLAKESGRNKVMEADSPIEARPAA